MHLDVQQSMVFQIAARSMLKYYIETGDEKPYSELNERYELFYRHFGDAIFCSSNVQKSGNKRPHVSRQPPGRIFLRKLRPITKVATRGIIKTEIETEEMMDFYSNSSRQDFNLLADMGVPSDIFEPEHRSSQKRIQLGPESVLSDAPEKISAPAQRFFETRFGQTVNRNPKIFIAFGIGSWPQTRLRRKWIHRPRVTSGFKGTGFIAKRLGSDSETRLELKQQLLVNSSYLELVL